VFLLHNCFPLQIYVKTKLVLLRTTLVSCLPYYRVCICVCLQQVWPVGQEVVAVYDFRGTTQEDLPFQRGDVLTIVKSTRVST